MMKDFKLAVDYLMVYEEECTVGVVSCFMNKQS